MQDIIASDHFLDYRFRTQPEYSRSSIASYEFMDEQRSEQTSSPSKQFLTVMLYTFGLPLSD